MMLILTSLGTKTMTSCRVLDIVQHKYMSACNTEYFENKAFYLSSQFLNFMGEGVGIGICLLASKYFFFLRREPVFFFFLSLFFFCFFFFFFVFFLLFFFFFFCCCFFVVVVVFYSRFYEAYNTLVLIIAIQVEGVGKNQVLILFFFFLILTPHRTLRLL